MTLGLDLITPSRPDSLRIFLLFYSLENVRLLFSPNLDPLALSRPEHLHPAPENIPLPFSRDASPEPDHRILDGDGKCVILDELGELRGRKDDISFDTRRERRPHAKNIRQLPNSYQGE